MAWLTASLRCPGNPLGTIALYGWRPIWPGIIAQVVESG
jgi:hypothetical protein